MITAILQRVVQEEPELLLLALSEDQGGYVHPGPLTAKLRRADEIEEGDYISQGGERFMRVVGTGTWVTEGSGMVGLGLIARPAEVVLILAPADRVWRLPGVWVHDV